MATGEKPMLLDSYILLRRLYKLNRPPRKFATYLFITPGLTSNAQSMKSQHYFTQAKCTIFLLLALFFSNALATPPKVVYRVDERSPEDIFSPENVRAFAPWGENDYLLAHVLGASLRRRGPEGSAFVATTETLEAAYRIALARFRLTPPTLRARPLYIYEIRADQNFYEVDRYLEALEQDPPEGENQQYIALARAAYRYQREWVAVRGILVPQVRLARQIYFREDQIDDQGIIKNEDFVEADTRANDGIYPVRGVRRLLGRQAFILNSTVEFLRGFAVSLAYCPPPTTDSKIRLKVAESDCHNPTVIHLNRDLTGLTEILPILLNED